MCNNLYVLRLLLQVGRAEERALGSGVAHAAREETPFPAAAFLLPTLLNHGNQSKGEVKE